MNEKNAFTTPIRDSRIEAVLRSLHAAADVQEAEMAARPPDLKNRNWGPNFLKHKMIPIHREQGAFLYLLARSIRAKTIVEFGTSHGLSTPFPQCTEPVRSGIRTPEMPRVLPASRDCGTGASTSPRLRRLHAALLDRRLGLFRCQEREQLFGRLRLLRVFHHSDREHRDVLDSRRDRTNEVHAGRAQKLAHRLHRDLRISLGYGGHAGTRDLSRPLLGDSELRKKLRHQINARGAHRKSDRLRAQHGSFEA